MPFSSRNVSLYYGIDGYYLPRPQETKESAFRRAQAEYCTAIEQALKAAQAFTFEQFQAYRADPDKVSREERGIKDE